MADELGPVTPGQISPFLKSKRVINAALEATRNFQRTQRRPLGQMPFDDTQAKSIFVANLTEATGAADWQSRTLNSSGTWVDDTEYGADNAYPVQCAGAAFTPNATATSIMWEEPPGSGNYAFLPIQYASATEPGFVSTSSQTFAGAKTFAARATFVLGAELGAPGTDVVTDVNGALGFYSAALGVNTQLGVGESIASGTPPLLGTAAQFGASGYSILDGLDETPGATSTQAGMEFLGGIYVGGDIEFPDPPDLSGYVLDVSVDSTGISAMIDVDKAVSAGSITFDFDWVYPGATGTDPDGGIYDTGLVHTKPTLGGVDTTWTVAVGDVVVISKGRIQSITPGS